MYSAFIKNSFIQTVHIFCILVSYILLNKNTIYYPSPETKQNYWRQILATDDSSRALNSAQSIDCLL